MNKHMEVIMAHVKKIDKHAQVSVNKEITRHGDKALEALLSEFGQLNNYNTFDPQYM